MPLMSAHFTHVMPFVIHLFRISTMHTFNLYFRNTCLLKYFSRNVITGLEFAVNLLRKNSRKNFGAFPVVVFITDGDYNVGGNPLPQVEALKREGVGL